MIVNGTATNGIRYRMEEEIDWNNLVIANRPDIIFAGNQSFKPRYQTKFLTTMPFMLPDRELHGGTVFSSCQGISQGSGVMTPDIFEHSRLKGLRDSKAFRGCSATPIHSANHENLNVRNGRFVYNLEGATIKKENFKAVVKTRGEDPVRVNPVGPFGSSGFGKVAASGLKILSTVLPLLLCDEDEQLHNEENALLGQFFHYMYPESLDPVERQELANFTVTQDWGIGWTANAKGYINPAFPPKNHCLGFTVGSTGVLTTIMNEMISRSSCFLSVLVLSLSLLLARISSNKHSLDSFCIIRTKCFYREDKVCLGKIKYLIHILYLIQGLHLGMHQILRILL